MAQSLSALEAAAKEGRNIMELSIGCAKASVATGEWGCMLRAIFGEYRAPTGVGQATEAVQGNVVQLQNEVEDLPKRNRGRIKFLVGTPGLDGHSNGAEQIGVRARDCGMDVVYEGIHLTPSQIVRAAINECVQVVNLSILSGSHVSLVKDINAKLDEQGATGLPIVVGHIIPDENASTHKQMGVGDAYTPKDFQLSDIMSDIVRLADAGGEAA